MDVERTQARARRRRAATARSRQRRNAPIARRPGADLRARERKIEKIQGGHRSRRARPALAAGEGAGRRHRQHPAELSREQRHGAGAGIPSRRPRVGRRADSRAARSDVGARRRRTSTKPIAASSRRARPRRFASTPCPIATTRRRSPTSRCSRASISRPAGRRRRTSISSSSITDADARLRPGMSAVARIAVGRDPEHAARARRRDLLRRRAALSSTSAPAPRFDEVPVEIVRRGREQVAVKGALAAGRSAVADRPARPHGKGGAK